MAYRRYRFHKARSWKRSYNAHWRLYMKSWNVKPKSKAKHLLKYHWTCKYFLVKHERPLTYKQKKLIWNKTR